MHIEQGYWQPAKGFLTQNLSLHDKAQLVIYFGDKSHLEGKTFYDDLKKSYPKAHIVGCSTGGEILHSEVGDDQCVFSAMAFDHTQVRTVVSPIDSKDSYKVGEYLGKSLSGHPDLVSIFILSDGINVNGSELVRGVNGALGKDSGVVVTGGLAGDGDRFQSTLVGCDDYAKGEQVVAVGFYGKKIKVKTGTQGGWKSFGPRRMITKSDHNVVYTIDDQPALDVYKKYLGEESKNLPGSALYYPLLVYGGDEKDGVIRTILSLNEEDKSMVFAGEMPQGWNCQFMWGKFDDLIDSAALSGAHAKGPGNNQSLSFMISCIGRKLLMGQHIIGEVESAVQALGENNAHMGFYSYGEIAPGSVGQGACLNTCGESLLHNQTMTITTLWEDEAA